MSSAASSSSDEQEPQSDEHSNVFTCNICFDEPTDPVLTQCGHLYCWSCLHEWLNNRKTCPVCNASCDAEKVIPIYGRGKESTDPKTKTIPPRPAAHRPPSPPPQPHHQIPQFNHAFRAFPGGFSFQFGTGVGFVPPMFPFGGFMPTLQPAEPFPRTNFIQNEENQNITIPDTVSHDGTVDSERNTNRTNLQNNMFDHQQMIQKRLLQILMLVLFFFMFFILL